MHAGQAADLLSLQQVREIAESLGYTEQKSTPDVVIFRSTQQQRIFPSCVEVYLKTGDVCAYIPHPRQKAYRLFYFGALYSHGTMTEIFCNPWSDFQFSYRLSDIAGKPDSAVPTAPPPLPAQTAIERQLAVIDREMNDLRAERLELRRRLRQLRGEDESGDKRAHAFDNNKSPSDLGSFQSRIQEEESSHAPPVDVYKAGDRVRGNKGIWTLFFTDAQEEFGRAWGLKPVAHVALGRGYVVAYDDGSVTWCDICPLLETKLRQQGLTPVSTLSPSSSKASATVRIRYIVLGSESNFYVKFDNGRMEWCGQDSFGDCLRRGVNDRRLLVDKVAFGQNGGWLVLWSDGSYEAEGMPQTLLDRLRKHSRSAISPRASSASHVTTGLAPAIKDVTVGPTGEWFVIYKDHSVQADNLPDALYKSLSQIREKSGRVRSITFGENRSWFVRYWDGGK